MGAASGVTRWWHRVGSPGDQLAYGGRKPMGGHQVVVVVVYVYEVHRLADGCYITCAMWLVCGRHAHGHLPTRLLGVLGGGGRTVGWGLGVGGCRSVTEPRHRICH